MRALFSQLSGLVGLLAFISELLDSAPLDEAIFDGVTAGLALYVVLFFGQVAFRFILEHSETSATDAEASELDPETDAPSATPAMEVVPDKKALAA